MGVDMWSLMASSQREEEERELAEYSVESVLKRFNTIKEKYNKDNYNYPKSIIERRNFSLSPEKDHNLENLTKIEIKTIDYYISLFEDDLGLMTIIKGSDQVMLMHLINKYEDSFKYYKEESIILEEIKNRLILNIEVSQNLTGNGL